MAYYKDETKVKNASDDLFDMVHKPGDQTTYAGIYRCEGCGHEIGIAGGHTLASGAPE
ncbi:MAG: hypothetical protein JWM87_1538 [Candidatus Eremiobacteraeota bacterium]|nr:hypothetical protein [Candidatus Eremiobacteraeota bacterium]